MAVDILDPRPDDMDQIKWEQYVDDRFFGEYPVVMDELRDVSDSRVGDADNPDLAARQVLLADKASRLGQWYVEQVLDCVVFPCEKGYTQARLRQAGIDSSHNFAAGLVFASLRDKVARQQDAEAIAA